MAEKSSPNEQSQAEKGPYKGEIFEPSRHIDTNIDVMRSSMNKSFKTPSESADGKRKTTGLPDSPDDPREGMDVQISRGRQRPKDKAPRK